MVLITDFGAVGDGRTCNTAAIQKALDTCSDRGGGCIEVPPGMFLTGTLWLRDNIELHLASGAVLLGSPEPGDYNSLDAFPQNDSCQEEEWNGAHLIIAHEVKNAAITGAGVIDGNGTVFYAPPEPFPDWRIWRDGLALAKDKKWLRPGQLIYFCECENIRVSEVTLRNASCWCCLIHGCIGAEVTHVKIYNPPYAANTDGIDIDASENVLVTGCVVDTGDDAIAIRGNAAKLKNRNRICRNIMISDCILASSSSVFRIGVGQVPISHVRVSDIIIRRGGIGLHFMPSYRNPGAGETAIGTELSDIHFRGISAYELGMPFYFQSLSATSPARASRISISDFTAESFLGGIIAGTANAGNSDILLRDVSLRLVPVPAGAADFNAAGLDMEFCDRVTLENVRIDLTAADRRITQLFTLHDCGEFQIRGGNIPTDTSA